MLTNTNLVNQKNNERLKRKFEQSKLKQMETLFIKITYQLFKIQIDQKIKIHTQIER